MKDTIPVDKSLNPQPENARTWTHLVHIADKLIPYNPNMEIELLIGFHCPRALKPTEPVPGIGNNPWAIRTILGWGIAGLITGPVGLVSKTNNSPLHLAFRTNVIEVSSVLVKEIFKEDFSEKQCTDRKRSVEDTRFIKIMENDI